LAQSVGTTRLGEKHENLCGFVPKNGLIAGNRQISLKCNLQLLPFTLPVKPEKQLADFME